MSKMSFDSFVEVIKANMEHKFADSSFVIEKVAKTNIQELTGISKRDEGIAISPCVYMEDWYQNYTSAEGNDDDIIDVLVDKIANVFENATSEKALGFNFDINTFTDFEKVKPTLILKIINVNGNEDYLSDTPHKVIANDLAVFVISMVGKDIHSTSSIKVKHEHLEMWNADFNEVYTIALGNTEAIATAKDMLDTFCDIRHKTREEIIECMGLGEDEVASMGEQIVVSTQNTLFGAAAIASKSVLNLVRLKFGAEKIVIIPSSIHEVICLKADSVKDYDYINSLINMVNTTEVSAEEVLSDHAYIYDGYEVMPLFTMVD